MEGPRLVVLLLIFLLVSFTPDRPLVQRLPPWQTAALEDEKNHDFDVLANSTYGELIESGLNLTGFRIDDGYHWSSLQAVQDLSRHQRDNTVAGADLSVYNRINGAIRGDFVRSDVALGLNSAINLTHLDPYGDYLSHIFDRNVTDAKGEIAINFDDSKPSNEAREIRATVAIYGDSTPGNGYDFRVQGVHFADGAVLMTTSSRKYNALPVLPHFALTPSGFNDSLVVVNKSVTELWNMIERIDLPFMTTPSCELIVWLHQKPLPGGRKYIDTIEDELIDPKGAPLYNVPPMVFAVTVFSPDCGFVLQAEHAFGPKEEAYFALVRRLLSAFVMILLAQIWLVKRQMQKSSSPSSRSRISYYTIGIAAFGDGLTLFSMLGLLLVDHSAFLLAGAAAFFCCIHVAFFEVQFIFHIWTVQVADPALAERSRQRRVVTTTAPPQPESQPVPTTTEGLPLPATARMEGAAPITLASDQDSVAPRASFAGLYTKFYFALVNLMFFSLWALSWPSTIRSIYANILAFCFFSLWIPQIYRNIMRNCRKALTWEYVLGSSSLRAIPVLYWYVADGNLLHAKPRPRSALFLLAWLGSQVTVLLSQQFLGPRLFVKDSWCPPAYDYHPVLFDDLEAGGLPIGELTSATEGKDKDGRRKVFDCAICMNEIDVPVMSKQEHANGRGWLEQRNYMVTPCRHIFHSECLEGWMDLRLVCPVCRESLPPI